MAITRVGLIGTIDVASASTHDITVGASGVGAGSSVTVRGGLTSGAITVTGVTDSGGNTYTVDVMDTGVDVRVFICKGYIVTPLVNTNFIRITLSSATGCLAVATEFSGIANSAMDKSSVKNPTSFGTAWTSDATVTTTQDDELCIGIAAVAADIRSTPEASWTEEDDFNGPNTARSIVTQYKIVAATGAYSASGTWASNAGASAAIATYKGSVTPITGLGRKFLLRAQ